MEQEKPTGDTLPNIVTIGPSKGDDIDPHRAVFAKVVDVYPFRIEVEMGDSTAVALHRHTGALIARMCGSPFTADKTGWRLSRESLAAFKTGRPHMRAEIAEEHEKLAPCAHCRFNPVAYHGAVYCGAACAAEAEMRRASTGEQQKPKLAAGQIWTFNDGPEHVVENADGDFSYRPQWTDRVIRDATHDIMTDLRWRYVRTLAAGTLHITNAGDHQRRRELEEEAPVVRAAVRHVIAVLTPRLDAIDAALAKLAPTELAAAPLQVSEAALGGITIHVHGGADSATIGAAVEAAIRRTVSMRHLTRV